MKRALAIVIVLASSAHADRKAALRYHRAGENAYQAQNFAAAAQNFEEAYRELPAPEIAFSAAQAYRRQYRVDPKPEYVKRAVELYRVYLAAVKTGGRVGDAADNLGEMIRELDKLGGAHSTTAASEDRTRLGVTISLGTSHNDSLHEIDDQIRRPQTPVVATIDGTRVEPDTMIEVVPGEHTIHVEAKGFTPAEKTERAVAGHSGLIEVELQPLPVRVAVDTEAGAQIIVDGRHLGTAPTSALEIPAGKHVLTVIRRGRIAVAHELVADRGDRFNLDEHLTPTVQRRAASWVLFGAGLLSVATLTTAATAIVEDRVAAHKLDDLRRGNQAPELGTEYANARARRDQFVTGTWLLGTAALAIAAVGGALYYFDVPSEDNVHLTPIATSTGGGAMLSGRF